MKGRQSIRRQLFFLPRRQDCLSFQNNNVEVWLGLLSTFLLAWLLCWLVGLEVLYLGVSLNHSLLLPLIQFLSEGKKRRRLRKPRTYLRQKVEQIFAVFFFLQDVA